MGERRTDDRREPGRDLSQEAWSPRAPHTSSGSNIFPADGAAQPHARVGPYELLSRLGEGGMGQVWLARHTVLDCHRAVKLLRTAVAENRRWRRRMLREARIVAQLNHPGIAMLHEFLDDGPHCCLILEYVPGRTLADRLADGPLTITDTTDLARRIAEAMAYAHHQMGQLVHRDLKPGNVMLADGGGVKLLDWGIASIGPLHPGDSERTSSTGPHRVIGTPGYMSPEQACGKPADRRADIWAFGCIVYECVTGRRAFTGESTAEILRRTLEDDPDWSCWPHDAPHQLRDLAAACLRKNVAERIGSIEEVLARLDDGVPATRPHHTPNNLPPPLTSFVGRHRELEELGAYLSSTRLLSITGPGGAGKTRAALELMQRRRDLLPARDGVWFVDLAALADPALVCQAVAAALPVEVDSLTGDDAAGTLAQRIGERALVLVLDNCEHVHDASRAMVETLMRRCPNVHIVATSRRPLNLPGEHNYRLSPMTLPDAAAENDPHTLRDADAARLFVDRASMINRQFELTAHNAPAVARVCRAVDGMPLAIELAAGRLRAMSVEQIADRLDDMFALLVNRQAEPTERHGTLEATIDWSYRQLNPADRLLLNRLSAFQGGWTLEAAEAVCADDDAQTVAPQQSLTRAEIIDRLESLVDQSLVLFELRDGWPRYRMLQAVQQYCRTAWADPHDERTIRGRHFEYYLGLAEAAQANQTGVKQSIWLERLELDHDNLRAAFQWATESAAVTADLPLRLASAMHWFCYVRGYHREGRHRIEAALARIGDETSLLLRSQGHNSAGMLAVRDDLTSVAREHYESALKSLRELGDERRQAAVLNNLGMLSITTRDLECGRRDFDRAAALYRKLDEPYGEACVQLNAGVLEVRVGALDAAQPRLEACREQFERNNDSLRLAEMEKELGEIAWQRGDLDRAMTHARQALRGHRTLGERPGLTKALALIARIIAAQGESDRAAQLLATVQAWATRYNVTLLDHDHACRRSIFDEETDTRTTPADRTSADPLTNELVLTLAGLHE